MKDLAPETSLRLLAGVGMAAALCGLGLAIAAPGSFFPAYLAMICGWSTVPIGCLALLMTTYLIGGAWTAMRPALAAGASTLPVTGLLFLPVLAGIGWIYPWAQRPVEADVPWFRTIWLSPAFFCARTVVFFLVLCGCAVALRRAGQESAKARIACVGLIAWTILGTFTAVDWMVSVEPRFHSSIFGLIVLSQQLLAGAAAAILLSGPVSPKESGMAGILLSALLFWAYLHAMQFIIIWTGNIPVEVAWILRRGVGAWGAVAALLGLGQFLALFNALLLGPIRRSRPWLVAIAIGTVAMRPLETAWLTLPAVDPPGLTTLLSALASLLAIAAGCGFSLLRGRERSGRPRDGGLASPERPAAAEPNAQPS